MVSSAYLKLLIFLPAILILACASSSPAFLMMYSAYKLSKQGDNIQPWHTHFTIWNQSVVPCPVLTVASWPAYRFLKRQVFSSLSEFSAVYCDPHSHRLWHSQLKVVKQEMPRVDIDILGINEIKWTGMGEFKSDDHYICYCGQESLRTNGVAIIVNKRVWNAVLGYSLKNDRMISVHFQGKPFNITVIQVYALISNA